MNGEQKTPAAGVTSARSETPAAPGGAETILCAHGRNVESGERCRTCATNERLQKRAQADGFVYLPSNDPAVLADKELVLFCPKGHVIHRSKRTYRGTRDHTITCPECVLDTWNEELRATAKNHGGLCLQFPADSTSKGIFRCALGHEFQMVRGSIRRGIWCPVCAQQVASLRAQSMRAERLKLIEKAGFTVVEQVSESEYRFRCPKGHEYVRLFSAQATRNGCPHCVLEEKASFHEDRARRIQELADSAKFEFLTPYQNMTVALHLRCPNGHCFERMPQSFMKATYCPTCNKTDRSDPVAVVNVMKDKSVRTSSDLMNRREHAKDPDAGEQQPG